MQSQEKVDVKEINGVLIELWRRRIWNDNGHGGIEKSLWVNVRSGKDIYHSPVICFKHMWTPSMDMPQYDAHEIAEISAVPSKNGYNIKLTDGKDVNFWLFANRA